MGVNEAVGWALGVVARGWPRRSAPVVQRIEWYEELAGAYAVLAAQATVEGDLDRYLVCADLAEHAGRLGWQLRESQQR